MIPFFQHETFIYPYISQTWFRDDFTQGIWGAEKDLRSRGYVLSQWSCLWRSICGPHERWAWQAVQIIRFLAPTHATSRASLSNI